MSSKVDKITAVTEEFDGYEKQRAASELTEEAQALGMYDGDTIEELRATCAALRCQVEHLKEIKEEYEGAICWNTCCATCGGLLDQNYDMFRAIQQTIEDLVEVGIHNQPFLQKIKERLERAIRPQDESSQSP